MPGKAPDRAITQALYLLKMRVALVPPKPKLFDITQLSSALSMRLRTIGISAKAGSNSSILALSQIKPLFIIRSEKIASCTPMAPREWPVSDLVAEIGGTLLPKTARIASISFASPTCVLVPCGLM